MIDRGPPPDRRLVLLWGRSTRPGRWRSSWTTMLFPSGGMLLLIVLLLLVEWGSSANPLMWGRLHDRRGWSSKRIPPRGVDGVPKIGPRNEIFLSRGHRRARSETAKNKPPIALQSWSLTDVLGVLVRVSALDALVDTIVLVEIKLNLVVRTPGRHVDTSWEQCQSVTYVSSPHLYAFASFHTCRDASLYTSLYTLT